MPILTQGPGIVPFTAALASAGGPNANATSVLGTSVGGTGIQLLAANNTTTGLAVGSACPLVVPGSGKLEGRQFLIKMGGVINIVTTSATIKTDFYGITGTTGLPTVLGTGTGGQLAAGSYTKLTSATASASLTGTSGGTAYTFQCEMKMWGDTISGTLNGALTTWYANAAAPVDSSVINTQLTSVTFGPATGAASTVLEPAAFIVPAFTFSANHAGSFLQVDYFYLYAD